MADPDYIPEEEEEEGQVSEEEEEEVVVREKEVVLRVVEVQVPEGEIEEQEQGGRLTHRLPPPHPPCACATSNFVSGQILTCKTNKKSSFFI